ncbi:putative baseplate assembly protein [Halomonas urmiana]|uniref:Putative baseplate assembly protein n=1 Tax=Halomonas urmiana TaxID=490901 RepID=A0A5R8ML83_9GAMM|nr:putative baseplate assembly protein [Halomonas urmiana]TLF52874.1 putative baseplate assembly protein [Halomonas urmiana]
MIYTCCDENRRAAVDAHPTLNGIDFLEVLDKDSPEEDLRQRTLLVRLLKPVPGGIAPHNVRLEGGERIRDIGVTWVGIASAPPPSPVTTQAERDHFTALPETDRVLLVRTDRAGDFSHYRLILEQAVDSQVPLPDFDPRLSAVAFGFKVECPSDFDCAVARDCSPEPRTPPDLNYLARDYASLRRLVIDRLSRQMPGWRDRSPADLATTLGELIAYVGDLQHYQLDAIGSEAYLHTARRRTSLRRHALLVDYHLHEGCNARAWLHVEISSGPPFALPDGLQCFTSVPGVPARIAPASPEARPLREAAPLVFEPLLLEDQPRPPLHPDHNRFDFYTWGDVRCCLPVGATSATLEGHWPDLAAGEVLVFEEVLGPRTGEAADADPAHRHAVRLTSVRAFDGASRLTDPLDDTEITEIRWHAEDALPFPLCLSSETDEDHSKEMLSHVSIALGNIVLVDHGERILDEALGRVPEARLHYPALATDACAREAPEPLPPRFRPRLAEGPVTHQGQIVKTRLEHGQRRSERLAFDPEASAHAAFQWRVAEAIPQVTLRDADDAPWSARRVLLDSRGSDAHFVVEVEDDGAARLRFGDATHGRRPASGTALCADYRIGNGPAGNVGADSIAHVITAEARIAAVRNPLPARGGVAPESLEEVRRHAPQAFRTQQRAVTPADYAEVTERLAGVQRAAAGLRWTGSWYSVLVAVDRQGGEPVDAAFASGALAHLDRYRMAGHDLRIKDPVHVSLEIDLLVCVAPGTFRHDVRRALLEALGSRTRADGTRGLFHPDNFSFGQTVFLSPLYAAARRVEGVASVQVTRFHRQGQEAPGPLADGFMMLGPLEIARLDNDRNFPEHGVLRLDLHGGL